MSDKRFGNENEMTLNLGIKNVHPVVSKAPGRVLLRRSPHNSPATELRYKIDCTMNGDSVSTRMEKSLSRGACSA